MLRLEKLEMIGFKSFMTRTEFVFNEGITAVVGPNGCGKSNIADALHWVIGEQSVKSLRGDRMEDVIFNGTEGRRPTGMAEVSLHLKNGSDGFDESCVITRRLFRSGESEYLINGHRSRLRDIQETLARMNVGSGLYSIIEQGKVDRALNSRPKERRSMIEEAAGIAIYKTKKRQAEAKLEATQANLSRVNDIISELERQLRSLRRQAARARSFERTVEEIKRLERVFFFHEHTRLDAERRDIETRESTARAAESEGSSRLVRLEAALEEGMRLLEEKDRSWREQRDRLHGLDRSMDHHQREIASARQGVEESDVASRTAREEIAGLSDRLESIREEADATRAERLRLADEVSRHEADHRGAEAERDAIEERITGLEEALARSRSDLMRLVDDLSETRNRRRWLEDSLARAARQSTALETERSEAGEALTMALQVRGDLQGGASRAEGAAAELGIERDRLQGEQDRLETEIARARSERDDARLRQEGREQRLRALDEIEADKSGSGSREMARSLLFGEGARSRIVSDAVSVPQRIEAAAEAYLEAYLDAVVVPDGAAALGGISALKKAGKGRIAFLPEDGAPIPQVGLPEEVRSDPGYVGRLIDLVEPEDGLRTALAPALVRALVVTDLETAARLRPRAPFFDYITLEGDVSHTSGLVEGGPRRPDAAGILSRRRLMSDLKVEIDDGAAQSEELELRLRELESKRGDTVARVAALQDSVASAERELVALRLKLAAAIEEEERTRNRVEALGRESDVTKGERDSLSLEMEEKGRELAGLEKAKEDREKEIEAGHEAVARARASASEAAEKVASARSILSAARERLEAIDSQIARLEESERDMDARIEAGRSRDADLTRRRQEAVTREADSIEALKRLSEERTALEAGVKEGELALAEDKHRSEILAQEARAARADLDARRAERETVTLERERIVGDLRHLGAGAGAEDPAGIEAILAGVTEEERGRDREALAAELSRLKEKRDRMGPVNMMALEQFREMEERFTFLSTQRADLDSSIASLRETIARINRTSRERFLEAFEKVRGGFNEIFRTLFGGGRADIRLLMEEGDDDVLECGIDIIAQPPGKRLQSVSLMSGGEKALTAIAMLFSIFRFRPSPFCLLDEVDAPLDEINVGRFNRLVKSMIGNTQFVLITHNQRSMESADALYGITMEEPGVSSTISVILEGSAERTEAISTLPGQLAARHRGNGRRAALLAGAGSRDASRSEEGG